MCWVLRKWSEKWVLIKLIIRRRKSKWSNSTSTTETSLQEIRILYHTNIFTKIKWKEKLISNNESSASEMKISSVYQCQTQMKINSLSWSIWTLCCNDYMFLLTFKIIGLLPQYMWQSDFWTKKANKLPMEFYFY